jgi:hypothetical protein
MSNYQEVRALQDILFSEAVDGYEDLSLLAYRLVMHFEFDLTCEQIEWIVEGVMAQRDDYWNEALDAIDEHLYL